jgi:hypothetical protein
MTTSPHATRPSSPQADLCEGEIRSGHIRQPYATGETSLHPGPLPSEWARVQEPAARRWKYQGLGRVTNFLIGNVTHQIGDPTPLAVVRASRSGPFSSVRGVDREKSGPVRFADGRRRHLTGGNRGNRVSEQSGGPGSRELNPSLLPPLPPVRNLVRSRLDGRRPMKIRSSHVH